MLHFPLTIKQYESETLLFRYPPRLAPFGEQQLGGLEMVLVETLGGYGRFQVVLLMILMVLGVSKSKHVWATVELALTHRSKS